MNAWTTGSLVRPSAPTTAARGGASPEALWDAAREVRLRDTRTLTRLVRWRIPGVSDGQTFTELFSNYPFTLLDEGDVWSVSGLCGRIWTLSRDYPRLSGPEEFRAWDEPGTVRVLFAHWAEPGEDGARRWSARRGWTRWTRPRGCGCARCGRSSGRSSGSWARSRWRSRRGGPRRRAE